MTEPSHLDLDALADALAGADDGTGHLAGCASCTSRLGELAAAESRVTAALAGLPAPTVPDDVAQRLTAALAAEPALAPSAGRSASVTALPTGTARRRWVPAAAAAAVLVLSATGLGLAFLPGGGSDEASVAAGGASAGLPTSATGADYADEGAVAQVLPDVLAAPPAPLADSRAAGAGAGEAQQETGPSTDGSDDSAAQSADSGAAMTAQAPQGDPLERLRTPEGLADCLAALLPPEEPDLQPLALDYAQFGGAPALAVVLPDPDPAKLAVYVVGPECTAQDESLLTFLRVDAP